MYKIETHLHTSEVSGCAHLSASEMIERYAQAGYDTVFVCDHYAKKYFDRLGDMSWTEKTKMYLSGYTNAREAGDQLGVTVLPAIELTFANSPNDYLVYGITKEFLEKHPALYESNIEDFYPLAKSLGLLVVQAHPFRNNVCFPTPKYVDGLEIYNSNPRHTDYSDKTAALAKEENLLTTAGSDSHRPEDIGLSGLLSEKPIRSSQDFISLIKSGKATIIRG